MDEWNYIISSGVYHSTYPSEDLFGFCLKRPGYKFFSCSI